MSRILRCVRIDASSLTGRSVEVEDRHGTGLFTITEYRHTDGGFDRFEESSVELTAEQIREILTIVEANDGERRTS